MPSSHLWFKVNYLSKLVRFFIIFKVFHSALDSIMKIAKCHWILFSIFYADLQNQLNLFKCMVDSCSRSPLDHYILQERQFCCIQSHPVLFSPISWSAVGPPGYSLLVRIPQQIWSPDPSGNYSNFFRFIFIPFEKVFVEIFGSALYGCWFEHSYTSSPICI